MWPFRRKVETRDTLEDLIRQSSPATAAGIAVGPEQAQRLSAVWACVRILCDTISTLPAHSFVSDSRDPVEPAPIILRTPAAGTPFHDWVAQIMRSLLLHGNCWGVITQRAGAAFRPTQIELVEPHRIQIQTTGAEVVYRLDGREVPRESLWHVRGYPSAGKLLGLSPISYGAQMLGVNLAAEQFGATFFGDGAVPTGMISVDKHITETQAKDLSKLWNVTFSNVGGKRRVGVLGDNAKYAPVSIKPDESQFLETMQFGVRQVCRLFGCPPEMVAADSGGSLTYSNVEQRSIDFLTYAVNPWLVRLEHALTELVPRGQYVKFNAGGLLRTDLKTRYESYEIAIRAGFMTADQVRELEDWKPLPAGTTRPALEVAHDRAHP